MRHMEIGVDIVEIDRIRAAVKRYGKRFLERIFTARERSYCQSKTDPLPHLAARFAAKEAVFKAMGLKKKRLNWQDVEVLSRNSGKPYVRLSGSMAMSARRRRVSRTLLSLSHSRKYAVAQVVVW